MHSLLADPGNPKLLSPLTLAFVGDAVYELLVREHLCAVHGTIPPNALHKLAIQRVCAAAQSSCFHAVEENLTQEELSIFKRGRNANSTKCPKNSSPADYRRATGVEALFGYLYLSAQTERIHALFRLMEAMQTTEGKEHEQSAD